VSLPLRNQQQKHVVANSEIGSDDGVISGFFVLGFHIKTLMKLLMSFYEDREEEE